MNNRIKEELIDIREEFIKSIRQELLGPGSEFSIPDDEHELISNRPATRYSIGILYPQGAGLEEYANNDGPDADEDDIGSDNSGNSRVIGSNLDVDGGAYEKDMQLTDHKLPPNQSTDDMSEEVNLEEEVGLARQSLPSSMGITFFAKGDIDQLGIKVSFATYRRAKLDDCAIPFRPTDAESFTVPKELSDKILWDNVAGTIKAKSNIKASEITKIKIDNQEFKEHIYRLADVSQKGFVRIPHETTLNVKFTDSDYNDSYNNIEGTKAEFKVLRSKISNGIWSVTAMIINGMRGFSERDTDCLFQPKIEVTSTDEWSFVETNTYRAARHSDREEMAIDFLYRNKKIYGSGLGVSIDWDIDAAGQGKVWSEYFPQIEVPQTDFNLPCNNLLTDKELSMKYLSDLDTADKTIKIKSLKNLVQLYKDWITEKESEISLLEKTQQKIARDNMSDCKTACNRMSSGIQTLENNHTAYLAFELANKAMFMQRVHLRMQKSNSNKDSADISEGIAEFFKGLDYKESTDTDAIWRPFQIAFILMDINSIVNDSHPDRAIVDLIWFPTGGGKTEAYLGLTAFTIFYRRLAHLKESHGTAVIMRYTLRLLAAQQFTRAATLICACEQIRAANANQQNGYNLGEEVITIGLWIGGDHIPNKNTGAKSAEYHLKELLSAKYENLSHMLERHNKFQVLKCPWCGARLTKFGEDKKLKGQWGYALKNKKHFYMHCTHEKCPFEVKLPIQIIDEELYSNPPTLLFGTVDKFAMLPWNGDVGAFLAAGKRSRAPELIIQDEIHLISGALGTIVGLYEAAIESIHLQKKIKSKIIASTATIRMAKEQCSMLYNRDVTQFPSPGISAEDFFFSKEKEVSLKDKNFGRRYIGIMPSNRTKVMMEARVISNLMQSVYSIKADKDDELIDKLWTLTVYFNSLRDLGQASTLVDDDIKHFIRNLATHKFNQYRKTNRVVELTSRVTTSELNDTLDRLEKVEYSKGNIDKYRNASDILLATNMISVGIDIARLNTMLIVGQPKLTSEYIQASSRVGREFPGVVFIQYGPSKSRDRSHYESFRAYHESLYRFVEPTGATPFSKPARDRGIHAIVIAITRIMLGFYTEKSAIEFEAEKFKEQIKEIKDFILSRVRDINKRRTGDMQCLTTEIECEIDEIFGTWGKMAREARLKNKNLEFGSRYLFGEPKESDTRLLKTYNSHTDDSAYKTLTSMRNVEPKTTGQVVIWED
jgi:superfamily II DNA/RNA helicase